MEGEVMSALVQLGLTNAEAKVYLATVTLEGGTATEIAALAGKDRGNTHHTLAKLQQLGIVEPTTGSPTVFNAIEVTKALDHLFSLQSMRLRRLDELRKSISANVSSSSFRATPQAETYSIIKGRLNTYLRMIESVAMSKEKVALLCSAEGLTRLRRFRNFFQSVSEKAAEGVEFRIISEITAANLEDVKAFSRIGEFRHIRNQATNASVYDGKVASVALSINEKLDEDVKDHVALWTNGSSFVRTFGEFFDSIWFVAAPAEPMIKTLGLG
jgi:sugar-specific transcriptional regulator TrmB